MNKLFHTVALLTLIFTIYSGNAFSQDDFVKNIVNNKEFKLNYERAEVLLMDENYESALKMFKDLEEIWPDNPNLNYKIGFCYMQIRGQKAEAIPYLEKAIRYVNLSYLGDYIETTAPLEAFYLLGQANHVQYRFNKAIEYYNIYLNYVLDLNPDAVDEVKFMIEKTYNAKKLIDNPVSIRIENLGTNVNSQNAEYSPMISANKDYIIFTSRRESSTGGKKDEKGLYFEDIYITKFVNGKWEKAQPIKGKINTSGHEASISLSHDEQKLFIYKDDKGDGNIYMSLFINDDWTKPEKLPEPINSQYWETHASLAPDGKTLYFVSDRPGGYGGRDIYKSISLGDNRWTEPENLGSVINTKYDEDAPFILSDGVSLYFSSEGHENMGGFDIFISTISEDGFWSTPENIGYPINTTEDDVFYYPTADEKNAVFSTSRQRRGLGELDINFLTIVKPKKKYISVRGRTADDATFKSLQADVVFTDTETGQVVAKLQTDEETGQYKITLPMGKTYTIEGKTEGYSKASKEFTIKENEQRAFINVDLFLVKLLSDTAQLTAEDVNVGEKIILNNIFYDFDKSDLRPESKEELDRLIKLMNDIPTLVIEISSHTDIIGSHEYNIKLSQERAQSVVDYLIKNGISKDRLVAKGYGATIPVASNETDEGRQLNRRTEFKILKK
jgi:outer membrane protein OmpA-like peptidoglycan-associated protein/tetratricopeptide (TPR) repeat protein